jgi:hypothetical protein
MIQLQVDPISTMNIQKMVMDKVSQAETVVSKKSLTEIAKAVFTITSKQFLRDLSMAAIQDPDRFHHLYEWSAVGNPNEKLFMMKRQSVTNGKLTITFVPVNSTKYVPISQDLLTPGETGKVVSSRHIFREKMRIMEDNSPVFFETKKTIVFSPNGYGMVFVPKNTILEIMDPGGGKTKGALREFSQSWYLNSANSAVVQSKMIDRIGKEVSKTLNSPNSSAAKVHDTIRKVTAAYSKEITSI